jgi:hypothetical protein
MFRVDIYRHTSTVICDLNPAGFSNVYCDVARITSERLIYAIINDLLYEVIRPRCIRIHSWALSDWVKPLQQLNRL